MLMNHIVDARRGYLCTFGDYIDSPFDYGLKCSPSESRPISSLSVHATVDNLGTTTATPCQPLPI